MLTAFTAHPGKVAYTTSRLQAACRHASACDLRLSARSLRSLVSTLRQASPVSHPDPIGRGLSHGGSGRYICLRRMVWLRFLGVRAHGENEMIDDEGRWRGWLAFIVLLFGALVVGGRLVPAARWFFRQRADRVVREVGRRGIELPSFKLTRRGVLVHRLTHDPELLGAAEAYAGANGISMAAAMARVERYAREIVPSFNAFLYFRVGLPLAAWVSTSLYDVRVDPKRDLATLDDNT